MNQRSYLRLAVVAIVIFVVAISYVVFGGARKIFNPAVDSRSSTSTNKSSFNEISRPLFPEKMYATSEECSQHSEIECHYLSCENIVSPLASYKKSLKELCKYGISGIWIQGLAVNYSDPSSWETYINTKYGYQIKYPADFALTTDGIVRSRLQDIIPPPELGVNVSLDVSKYQQHENNKSPAYTMGVHISASASSDQLSLKDWYLEYARSNFLYDTDPSVMIAKGMVEFKESTFKGHQSLEVINKIDLRGGQYGGRDFYIAQNGVVLRVKFQYQEIIKENITPDIDPELVFDHMLASLEFLKQ